MDFDDDLLDDAMNKLLDDIEAEPKVEVSEIKKACPLNPELQHLKILSQYFGHKEFRPLQWEIISALLYKQQDVCAVMATGYGKSLCFQFPSLYVGGVTLVISPLISLMEDQVSALEVSNIPACLLGTAQRSKNVLDDIFQKKFNLVYVTPEFCTGEAGQQFLERMSKELVPVLVAIDEAHCISSWGHDFRFQYRELGVVRRILPRVPIIAVTATATMQVKEDIVKNLNLRHPLIISSGLDRPNLYFEVKFKSSGVYGDLQTMMEPGSHKFSGPTIVYCISRRDTEDVALILQNNGIKCLPYHAGMSLPSRQEAHESFIKDKTDVIVATIAFGMGIDKHDVRNVIHYGPSQNVESYYQEMGRAGRDGQPAKCVIFYNLRDLQKHRTINTHARCKEQKSVGLRQIEKYLTTLQCRRKFILEHFADTIDHLDKPRLNCCDICSKKLCDSRTDHDKYEGIDASGCYDFTHHARTFLRAADVFTSDKVGLSNYILFLRGSKSSRLSEHLKKHPLHGSGRDQPEAWWQAIVRLLIQEQMLVEKIETTFKGFSYVTVKLTPRGLSMMANTSETLIIPPNSAILQFLKAKPVKGSSWINTASTPEKVVPSTSKVTIASTTESQPEIDERMAVYHKLLSQRNDIALQMNCMPYTVASNVALMEMAKLKPKTIDEMRRRNFDGFNEAKIMKFGTKFLKVLNTSEESVSLTKKNTIKDLLSRHPLADLTANVSAQVSHTMLQSGLTVGEIAQKRGVTVGTITSHLHTLMKLGHSIKLEEFGVTEEVLEVIVRNYRKFCKTGFESVRLTALKEQCPEEITYEQIKASLAYLQIRYHLKGLSVPYEDFEDFDFDQVRFEESECSCAVSSTEFLPDESKCKIEIEEVKLDVDESASKKMKFEFESQSNQNKSDDFGSILEFIPDESKCKIEIEEVKLEVDEAASKKMKFEFESQSNQNKSDDFGSILDSPPRQYKTEPGASSVDVKEEVNYSQSSDTDNNQNVHTKKKTSLPQWLVRKKVN